MFVAQLASFRSKDPEKEVGSCIPSKAKINER
jgi:deoxycytidylate deaminase